MQMKRKKSNHFFLFSENISSTTPRSIYLIPIEESNEEIRVPSASHQAWEKLSLKERAQDNKPSFKHTLTIVKRRHSVPKCCSCYRKNKVGVDIPKCCELGIAEDHLYEHFFDDLILNTNACLCSLSTLAEVLPKLASQNTNTGNTSSDIEE